MLHFLPCVCSSYHKWDIKKNTPISQDTHVTDEALVTWFLKCYITDWEKTHEDRQQQVQGQGNANRQRRKEGKHKSKEELGVYMDLHASIKLATRKATGGMRL